MGSIIRAAGAVFIINIVVKLLGFLREMFIASGFGASYLTDAYLVAYTLPYSLQSVLGFALVVAVIPALARYWPSEDQLCNQQASIVGSSLINITAIVLLIASIIGIIFARALVNLTAPGLDLVTSELAVDLTRIIFPSVLFMGIGMVISGILNCRRRFAIAAIAPGIGSLIIIGGIIFFAGDNIQVLAWATLISFLGFLLIQIPALKRCGFVYLPVCDIHHPALQQAGKNIVPIIIGIAVNQVYIIINRIFASGLAEGSISALNYASKLMNMPLGIFVAAIATVIYPLLTQQALEKDKPSLQAAVDKGLNMIAFLALPATVGLIVLSEPIIRLLFESGSFDAEATRITAYALVYISPGLLFMGFNMLLTRAFYAMNEVKKPLIAALISIVVNIIASVLLMPYLSHGGLALANSLAAAVNTIILAWYLRRIFGGGLNAKPVLKMTLAALLMGVLIVVLTKIVPIVSVRSLLALQVLILVIAGCIGYFIFARLLGITILKEIYISLRKKTQNELTNTN